jgi:hypothetical protein
MSSPFITISGPIFPDMSGFIPGICPIGLAEGLADGIGMFIPGICPIGLAEGLADGIGMFIFVWGEAAGVGDAEGICMPGIFSVAGVGEGDDAGVGVDDGIGIPCLCCAWADQVQSTAIRVSTHGMKRVANITV